MSASDASSSADAAAYVRVLPQTRPAQQAPSHTAAPSGASATRAELARLPGSGQAFSQQDGQVLAAILQAGELAAREERRTQSGNGQVRPQRLQSAPCTCCSWQSRW